jgi:transmembrane protease serine 9
MKLSARVLFLLIFSTCTVRAQSPDISTPKYELRLGPSTLYTRVNSKSASGVDIPLVVRDALQSVSGGPRILAIDPRIVGGSPAPIGAYPWQVSIGIKGAPHNVSHFCGGSLIAPQWIITAAHCVGGGTSADNIEILAQTNLLSTGGQIILVDKIIVHEKWNPETFDHDVALLHLKRTSSSKPIQLVTPDTINTLAGPGLIAIVSGWGVTRETGNLPSNILRNVTVQIASRKDCTSPAAYGEAITDTMICAGFAEGGKDSCQGDSGGPLMVPDQKGSFILAGIVSWGEGCGQPSKYGIYTNVATIQKWATDKTAQ